MVGETGTGKELIARAIHANGRRAQCPFVPLNCAALPRDLVESELFGHRRGAFSGALTDHLGLFVGAHRGTLFLDEIGELAAEAQAKLLRVLQDGEVRPVGGLESRKVDVRIIAASNRSLAAMGEGAMRQDLFFRLSVLVIELPPLRDRVDDLPLLSRVFLARIRERGSRGWRASMPRPSSLLLDYPFPGNVRELENLLEGVSLTLPPDRTIIRAEDVRAWLRHRGRAGLRPRRRGRSRSDSTISRRGRSRRRSGERRATSVAPPSSLGISRDTLYRKLHELDPPGSRSVRFSYIVRNSLGSNSA